MGWVPSTQALGDSSESVQVTGQRDFPVNLKEVESNFVLFGEELIF